MVKDNINPPFANGYWIWEETINGLVFISRDAKEQILGLTNAPAQSAKNVAVGPIRFKDTIDNLAQAHFRRQFQRRIKPGEPQVVTIQDIKDVAFFTAESSDITPEFVAFMHTQKMDDFLRALIVYFQFYLQVWDNLMLRREEAKRKLRQPLVTILENIVRDNLADLRSMVARNYAYIIMGTEETFKHYHMSNRNNVSLSDKDQHLYECLLSMAPKIVWIALLRKNFTLIEIELGRIFRTQLFNTMRRVRKIDMFLTNPEEDRVLLGKANTSEKKLKHRSPAAQELIFDEHDYKMLAIGHLRVEPVEERIANLEAAYTAPEELLFEIGVGVGILGLSKEYLNPILMPKEGMGKRIRIPPFNLPPMPSTGGAKVNETLPQIPPKYMKTEQSQLARKTQCKIWLSYISGDATKLDDTTSGRESVSTSHFLQSKSDINILD